MIQEQFNSSKELFKRVKPALQTKKTEFERNQINFITEEDIWHYLRQTKWHKETNLTLFDIVNDILTINEKEILKYKNKE